MKALIQFDGGCRPTNPGNKYGSYSVIVDDVFEISRNRFPLGFGTNNEAEFESLLCALRDLRIACAKAGVSTSLIVVQMRTDSTIVEGWIKSHHQFKPKPNTHPRKLAMATLAGQCLEALKPFQDFTIKWQSRNWNVVKFGH